MLIPSVNLLCLNGGSIWGGGQSKGREKVLINLSTETCCAFNMFALKNLFKWFYIHLVHDKLHLYGSQLFSICIFQLLRALVGIFTLYWRYLISAVRWEESVLINAMTHLVWSSLCVGEAFKLLSFIFPSKVCQPRNTIQSLVWEGKKKKPFACQHGCCRFLSCNKID